MTATARVIDEIAAAWAVRFANDKPAAPPPDTRSYEEITASVRELIRRLNEKNGVTKCNAS